VEEISFNIFYMGFESSNKKEVKKQLAEEDVKARDKNLVWGAGATVGGILAAMSPVGDAVSKVFQEKELFAPESVSSAPSELVDTDTVDTEIIKVTLDGEEVASYERSINTPSEDN